MHGVGVGTSHAFKQTAFSWAAPTNSVAPVISGTPTQGLTLNLDSTGTWANSPLSFTYQWYFNTTNSTSGGTILTGETGSSYIEGSLVVADYVYCQVKAINPAAPSGVAVFSNVIGPVAAAGGLATPTLTNFSALGSAPVTLEWSTADYIPGMRAQLEIATDSGFVTITQNIIFFVDGASWALNDIAIGLLDPAGAYWARIRTLRDNESGTLVTGNDTLGNALSFNADVSAWSTTFTDTITSSTAAWTSTTGTKKHATLTVSGAPVLIMQGTAGQGFLQDVAATIVGGNKSQWEHTTTTLATDTNRAISFGRYNGTTDLSANNARPGVSDANGYTITYTPGSTSVFVFDNSATTIGNFTLGTAAALSDVWTDELDITGAPGAHVLKVYRNGTLVGTCSAQTLTGFNRAWAGVQSNEKLTANFGGTAFTHTLNSGFTNYG